MPFFYVFKLRAHLFYRFLYMFVYYILYDAYFYMKADRPPIFLKQNKDILLDKQKLGVYYQRILCK